MKKYLRRLYMKTDTEPFNPFLHLYVLKSLAFGIFFCFLNDTDTIQGINLYRLTTDYLPDYFGNLWGLLLLVTVVGHILEMLFRGKGIGSWVGILGSMLWLYAAFIYASTHQWFSFTAFVAINLFFWPWYYFSSVSYTRALRKGEISPIS